MDEQRHHDNTENNNATSSQVNQNNQDCDADSINSKELVTKTFDFTSLDTGKPTSLSCHDDQILPVCKQPRTSIPLLIFSKPTSAIVMQSAVSPPPDSNTNVTPSVSVPNQPQSLFLLTLAKLNGSSISLAFADRRQISSLINKKTPKLNEHTPYLPEPSPPDSLTSAPPSYSFVLRQMSARRRPRLMGTFIPSPSFVQHTPPPNYAAAFDIYLDNCLPTPTTRVYRFGFTPMPVICTECGYTGMTRVRTKVTLCTHLCAFVLCLFCCWICAPLPYIMRSCKDVYHYCRNCRNYLGMYCPTNPDNSYS